MVHAPARARRRLIAAAALVAALVASGVLLLWPGGDATAGPKLAWEGAPQLLRVPELPRDRVLVGRVRNASAEPLRLAAADVVVLDATGRRLESTARFAAGFGHPLYSPADAPDEVARNEELRLGAAAEIEPGDSAPLTLSWRLPRGVAAAAEARVGAAVLRLPAPGR